MAFGRRAPREVYRVFSEDDFLDGAGSTEPLEPVASEAGAPRLTRIAGVATLVGALAVVLGLLLINGLSGKTRGAAAPVASAVAHPFTQDEPHGVASTWRGADGSGRGDPQRRPAQALQRAKSGIAAPAAALPAPVASPQEGAPEASASEDGEFGFER